MKWSLLGPYKALYLLVALAVAAWTSTTAWSVVPPKGGEAVKSSLAKSSLLLGAVRAGQRMVAVGEFGNVVLSDDDGKTWRQANRVPTTLTLTSVHFEGDKMGWAVGHDAIVLHTTDGGENWTRQFGGGETNIDSALLSVFFKDAQNGMAVGAFNYTIETKDGGKTWSERKSLMPAREPPKKIEVAEEDAVNSVKSLAPSAENDPFATTGVDENHLNSIFAGPDPSILFVAAEGGAIYRSADSGATWTKIYTGYIGSFWGGLTAKDGSVYVTGMRGNIWRSTDQGNTFTKLDTVGADQSIAGGVQLRNGGLVFVGLGGQVLYTSDGQKFTLTYRADRKGLSSVMEDTNTLYVFGEAGVQEQTPTPDPAEIETPTPSGS